MTGSENFLSRWSRRKQEAASDSATPSDAPNAEPTTEAESQVPTAEAKPQSASDQEPQLDLSNLPPIESIGVGTDIRLFLQKGVPLELTRAALRRAWVADPAIRDFIEVAENQWDFATGKGLPGFGPLEASDDVRRMVAELFQGRPALPTERDLASKEDQALSDSTDAEPTDQATALLNEGELEIVHCKEENIAMQRQPKQVESHLPKRRGHGGALPQ